MWMRGSASLLVAAFAGLACVFANENVTVVRKVLTLEELHTLEVDNRVEYILQFIPNGEQGLWPSRLWVRGEGGDTTRPLLLTVRQRSGAITWQLPYESGNQLHYEFQRTLCPDDTAEEGSTDCGDGEEQEGRGAFSLHLGSWCARPVRLQLRVEPARDWRLSFGATAALTATHTAPSVHYYRFEPGQESVRLIIESDDDLCATVAVQYYSCPIHFSLKELQLDTVRMTVQRSGGVQLARSRFPRGFYVISAVHSEDVECTGVQTPDEDWLWEAAVWDPHATGPTAPATPATPTVRATGDGGSRVKHLTYRLQASLSLEQYAVAVAVTSAGFGAFYVLFGGALLLRRWPTWDRLVRPRAVLAHNRSSDNGVASEVESTIVAETNTRPRRGSNATFDSSDNSDTDSEDEPNTVVTEVTVRGVPGGEGPRDPAGPRPPPTPHGPPTTPHPSPPNTLAVEPNGQTPSDGIETIARNNTEQAPAQAHSPFGLPATLRVAALSRRRSRVLRARSDRYLYTLYTVAVFYALPVLQFVAAFQILLNFWGSLDLCYYNFLCAHPAGAVSDFNHVFSNVGYLALGALFMLQLRRRQRRRRRKPRDEEYGIPAHYGLLSSLGAGMMVVALLSSAYHICPNSLNFQFDTAFMYVLAVLSMVKIYQSRHPDINARAHATFGVLALFIALVAWGVLGGGALFWSLFTVLHVFTFLLLSLRIYYVGQFRLERHCLAEAARGLAAKARPLYTPRLVALLIANAANWAFALYGLLTQTGDIASHLLSILLCNTLLYIVFYLAMKLLHGERPRWYAWAYLAAAAATWGPALYFFTSGSTSWADTPAQSRHRNHECLVLQFYDSHDLWHMLSAVALYCTFNLLLTWDDGLAAVKRTDIAVF